MIRLTKFLFRDRILLLLSVHYTATVLLLGPLLAWACSAALPSTAQGTGPPKFQFLDDKRATNLPLSAICFDGGPQEAANPVIPIPENAVDF